MTPTAHPGGTSKVVVAAIAGACAAGLFVAGVAATVTIGVSLVSERWQVLREKQSTLGQARAQCPAFDPAKWGTRDQQVDACIAERTETDIEVAHVHPVFMILGWVAVLYLTVSGIGAWVAWGYCADEWGRAWWRGRRGPAAEA